MGSIDNAYMSVLSSMPRGGGKTKVKWRLGEIIQTFDGVWVAVAIRNVTPVWSVEATDWDRIAAHGNSIEKALLRLSEKLEKYDENST